MRVALTWLGKRQSIKEKRFWWKREESFFEMSNKKGLQLVKSCENFCKIVRLLMTFCVLPLGSKTQNEPDLEEQVASTTNALESSLAWNWSITRVRPNFKCNSKPRLKTANWFPSLLNVNFEALLYNRHNHSVQNRYICQKWCRP